MGKITIKLSNGVLVLTNDCQFALEILPLPPAVRNSGFHLRLPSLPHTRNRSFPLTRLIPISITWKLDEIHLALLSY